MDIIGAVRLINLTASLIIPNSWYIIYLVFSPFIFDYLRPGDRLLSISGTPYDTLHEVIGIRENASSLKSFGVLYDEIDLVNDDFDDERILSYLKENSVKMIEIQRSKGYSTRKSLGIQKLERIIQEELFSG